LTDLLLKRGRAMSAKKQEGVLCVSTVPASVTLSGQPRLFAPQPERGDRKVIPPTFYDEPVIARYVISPILP